AVLEHVDLFLSNSRYWGLTHAIANGVPMVQTGNRFDKPDFGRRVECSGLGVLLPQQPRPKTARTAVEQILGEEKCKNRIQEFRCESAKLDPFEAVGNEIMAL
ncbi:uncharacterized protein BCR38DRAFT_297005, partial [Pseudomassariella vexata]